MWPMWGRPQDRERERGTTRVGKMRQAAIDWRWPRERLACTQAPHLAATQAHVAADDAHVEWPFVQGACLLQRGLLFAKVVRDSAP
jgi:hypothetical protein